MGYSPDRDLVVSGGLDCQLSLWDIKAGALLLSLANTCGCYALGLSEDGNTVVSGGTDGNLRVWDARAGIKTTRLRGHTENVRAVRVSETGRHCISGASDGTIKVWDIGQQRCVQTLAPHTSSVFSIDTAGIFALQSNEEIGGIIIFPFPFLFEE